MNSNVKMLANQLSTPSKAHINWNRRQIGVYPKHY